MSKQKDRQLGMGRRISRRDFVNGVAVGTAGLFAGPKALYALAENALEPEQRPDYYPPALTGLRGSYEGSYTAAHALRDGTFWETAGTPRDTGETYDLVVVGGGISGLSAAHFFQKAAGSGTSVLVLDNHDDFGGHAKRNEFKVGGRTILGYGGTWSIDSPAPYSATARGLIKELGIDVLGRRSIMDWQLYGKLGLGSGIFFDKETFGADKLLPAPVRRRRGVGEVAGDPWAPFMADAPMSAAAKRDVKRIHEDKTDYMPGLSSAEKRRKLVAISYARFLTEIAKMDPGVLPYFQARPHGLYGAGIDAVSAQDAFGLGFPGFQGMGLDAAPGVGQGLDAIRSPEAEEYFLHFPDGNATLVRLLVRGLVPKAIPGSNLDDVVTARADYARLDEAGSAARIRLNSTAVRVRHVGEGAAKQVEITYSRNGALRVVHARRCVLACWNSVIPWICPELPEPQKQAMHFATKVPLLYTNVVIRSWSAFQKLGFASIEAPGGYHTSLGLDMPVNVGSYHSARTADEPVVVTMSKTPCLPGLPIRDQHKAGRLELFTTPWETLERNVRDQMARTLGAGGFDPARDILAITVNRWAHGYAYQYNSLFDDFWREGRLDEQPCLLARKPHGQIAIANSDAAAYAYTDSAIDQAHRAVQEVLKT
jgi:spermidine dehydrogenase